MKVDEVAKAAVIKRAVEYWYSSPADFALCVIEDYCAALTATAEPGEGWKMVPFQMTPAMKDAAREGHMGGVGDVSDMWEAAYLAAPGASVSSSSSADNSLAHDITTYLESRPGNSHADKLLRRAVEALGKPAKPKITRIERQPFVYESEDHASKASQRDLLRQCWQSGQMTRAQAQQHIDAGEMAEEDLGPPK